jgi:hypothetical protein
MKPILAILILLSVLSCERPGSADDKSRKEARLMQAMQTKLYQSVNNDSSTTKYRVLSVTYYEDKTVYLCEFKVRLQNNHIDTTGIMTADISKDMKIVRRKS